MPDHVIVNFEIGAEHEKRFDLDLSRFLYHSKQGWSGQGHATVNIHENAFSFGMVSDGDRLSERYAGIQAGFERRHVFTDRLQSPFRFCELSRTVEPGYVARGCSRRDLPDADAVFSHGDRRDPGAAGGELRRRFRAISAESAGSENRIVQRGGINSALPPALGFGSETRASTISAPPIRCARARIFSKAIRSSRGMKPKRAIASAAAIRIFGRIPRRNHLRASAPVRAVHPGQRRDSARME